MTSIERTAFPQFRRLTTARVLHVFFTPTEDEVAWARGRAESPEALLAVVTDLKCYQKMARFCSGEEIPQAVTDHVRHSLGLAPETEPDHGAARTVKLHRSQVRQRQGVTYNQRRPRPRSRLPKTDRRLEGTAPAFGRHNSGALPGPQRGSAGWAGRWPAPA